MKKNYLLLAFLLILSGVKVYSQCTPDLSWTQNGIRPDSATGLPHGCEGLPYSGQFDIYVPDSVHTVLPGTTNSVAIYIDSVIVKSITGVPSPLTVSVNPSSQRFAKYAHGCMLISGTAPAAGTYPITVVTKSNVRLLFSFVPATVRYDTIRYYKIVIDPTGSANCMVGINEQANPTQLSLLSIQPNPVKNEFNLRMNLPQQGSLKINLSNLLGQSVYHQEMTSLSEGYQTISIQDLHVADGIYLLSVEQNGQKITHKLSVVH